MKLETILSLAPIKATSPVVHSGVDNLDVPVTWVHLSEMEHVAVVLNGGEMLLTQGRGIPRADVGQRAWIESLSVAGVAGIGIETGHVFDELPFALVDEAKKRNLPLIELPRPAYFMEITRAVHSIIVQSEYDVLAHSVELTRRLGRVVLGGGTIQTLLDEITSALGAPVALTGPTHSLRSRAPLQDSTLNDISDWRGHTIADHDLTGVKARAMEASVVQSCLYVPIYIGGAFWGCLHTVTSGEAPDSTVDTSMEIAATFLAMALGPREDLRTLSSDMPSEILGDVLTTFSQDSRERLRWGGLDSNDSFRVLMFEPVEAGPDGPRTVEGHRRTEALLAAAQGVHTVIHGPSIVGYFQNRIAAIVPQEFEPNIFVEVNSSMRRSLIVGVSEIADSTGLPRAAKNAIDALDYALETGRMNGVFFAEQLFLERLLLRLNEDGTLRATVEHELGAILNLNTEMRETLLNTLEVYFIAGANKSRAASQLRVDRRTIQYRLDRINNLVGRNFQSADKQLALRLAIRGYRFLDASQYGQDC